MRKMAYIIIGLLFLGIVAYFLFKPKKKSISDEYFISTQGQSDNRIKSLSLDKPSEEASYILDTNKLSIPKKEIENESKEYKADPEREFIINIKLLNGGTFKKNDLWNFFDKEWRTNFTSAEVYGYSEIEKGWTYTIAGDAPDIYEKVQVAINLLGVYNDENPTYEKGKLEKYITALNKKVKTYPYPIELELSESVDKAIEKAKELVVLYNEFNQDEIIVLKSDKVFKGSDAWDALLSVGLKWGDGDLFHWNNYDAAYGHDQYFSVWTSTEPGYFLPEDIQGGQMNPNDLVFGFSIPRSADPKNIFDIMFNTVLYCQKRLGGTILDKEGNSFNQEEEKIHLIELVDKMKAKGIMPGSGKALRMY